MAAVAVSALTTTPVAAPSGLKKSTFSGAAVQGLPVLRTSKAPGSLRVEASTKKIVTKEPLGPSGDLKFKRGVDAGGRVPTGKGVYQFTKKYGANVDGYSPIYARDEWSKSGDVYAGGVPGLAIWATLLGGLLLAGAFLVYSTSALA